MRRFIARATWLLLVGAVVDCGGDDDHRDGQTIIIVVPVPVTAPATVPGGGSMTVADASVTPPRTDPATPAWTCADHTKDGDETDTDCGGSCPPCALGQYCQVRGDCSPVAAGCNASRGGCACDGVTLTCVTDHCIDHRKDADESDVDCGGADCAGCGPNMTCYANGDCSGSRTGCDMPSGRCFCDVNTSTCVVDHCLDHVKDVDETDLDCGGKVCLRCATDLACQVDTDCQSGGCDALSLRCVVDPCADHRKDGQESDVDCGGGVCASCPVGRACNINSDCQPGHACNGSHVCQ